MKTFALSKTFVIPLEEYHALDDANIGYCLECGAERGCCEPDAREYPCEECGTRAVYGAEELLMMGHVK